jgi:hypothetical protein
MAQFTAVNIVVMNNKGETERYTVSLGSGPKDEIKQQMRDWMHLFATGKLNNIDIISKVQAELSAAGYGISNRALVSVSPTYQIKC